MSVPRLFSSLDSARDRRQGAMTLTRRAFTAGAIAIVSGVAVRVASGLVVADASAAPGAPDARQVDVTQQIASPEAAPQVIIENFTFSPAELTVAVGTEVTWENRDDIPHTVTSEDTTNFAS